MPEIPATATQPQDRKPKKAKGDGTVAAEATEAPVVVEHNGVEYTLRSGSYGDVDLVEDLQEYVDGSVLVLPRIVQRLIGPEQYAAFKKTNRGDDGIVPLARLVELFKKIDGSLGK